MRHSEHRNGVREGSHQPKSELGATDDDSKNGLLSHDGNESTAVGPSAKRTLPSALELCLPKTSAFDESFCTATTGVFYRGSFIQTRKADLMCSPDAALSKATEFGK
jgi:hypothetical protein